MFVAVVCCKELAKGIILEMDRKVSADNSLVPCLKCF